MRPPHQVVAFAIAHAEPAITIGAVTNSLWRNRYFSRVISEGSDAIPIVFTLGEEITRVRVLLR